MVRSRSAPANQAASTEGQMRRERHVLKWFDDGGVWIARASRDVVKPVREACSARMSEAISGSNLDGLPRMSLRQCGLLGADLFVARSETTKQSSF
jgi:hypothetical protein